MLVRGKEIEPNKDLVYGAPGSGKTPLGITYPKPVIVDFEGSATQYDCVKWPVKSYSDFLQFYEFILSEEGFEFETVVFDTIDWFEQYFIQEILRIDDQKSITNHKAYGFGAGDKRIAEFIIKTIFPILETIHQSGKNIVLLAHSYAKNINDPKNGAYDIFTLKLTKSGSSLFSEWAQNMFYIEHDINVESQKGLGKPLAVTTQNVKIHTRRTGYFDAKRRNKDISDVMSFNFKTNPYIKHVWRDPIESVLAEFEAMIKRCNTTGDLEFVRSEIANTKPRYNKILKQLTKDRYIELWQKENSPFIDPATADEKLMQVLDIKDEYIRKKLSYFVAGQADKENMYYIKNKKAFYFKKDQKQNA